MVKTWSIVLEEKIASEAQRLKLKYFGDRSLEMAIPSHVPLTYRGLSGEEVVEAEEDFYYKWRFHVFVLTGEERWDCLRTLAEDKVRMVRTRSQRIRHAAEGLLDIKTAEVRERIFCSLGYDAELPMRACQLEGLDTRSRELEYVSYFYESFFHVFMRDSAERERYKASDMESGNDASVLKSRTREKGSGSRRWEYSSIVRGKLDSTADSHSDTEGVKSVERKESLLDEVAEEKTKLELVLGELGLSRKKRVESMSKKVVKAQSTRSMTGVDGGKRQTSGEEIKKALPAFGTTMSGEVAQGKRKRVEPLGGSEEKVAKERSALVDDLKEVEERARLAILQGNKDTSQMIARLVKGIWLGIEEQESELKKAKSELEKILARAKADALKEVKQLRAAHAAAIDKLQVEINANLYEMNEERDRLGCHLMLKGYSQEEVDVIKADTYAEEEEEEAEVLGVVDGLDGVSPQTVVREMSLTINDLESGLARDRETLKALLSAQAELQVELDVSRVREDHALMCNRKFVEHFDRMKEANKNREDQYVKAHFRLEKLNQGHFQKGNANLRECQHKMDATLIREKVLEGEIRAKDFLVKRKDELLKDLPAREELNTELGVLRARVVELQTMNLAESTQYIAKLKEDVIYHDRVDADIIAWKDTCVSLKVRLERLKARFAKGVAPDVA
ncbi:hypothetical protein GIB67_042403 [Kingdonia uniflora]|uniref:Uncharacterized protein n=1 Tax=Kingdonia uniflora TaxID=39325 RepID=A0A7J7M8I8_9MAGN|nr:hypothetical protein GIB67_042403 [Kingdonia uniflora]